MEATGQLPSLPSPKSGRGLHLRHILLTFQAHVLCFRYTRNLVTSGNNFNLHVLCFRYTRNLVTSGNNFNLLVLCWNMSQGSSIHAHANSHCFMKILDGAVREERFDWPSDSKSEAPMIKTSENKHTKDSCAYIHGK